MRNYRVLILFFPLFFFISFFSTNTLAKESSENKDLYFEKLDILAKSIEKQYQIKNTNQIKSIENVNNLELSMNYVKKILLKSNKNNSTYQKKLNKVDEIIKNAKTFNNAVKTGELLILDLNKAKKLYDKYPLQSEADFRNVKLRSENLTKLVNSINNVSTRKIILSKYKNAVDKEWQKVSPIYEINKNIDNFSKIANGNGDTLKVWSLFREIDEKIDNIDVSNIRLLELITDKWDKASRIKYVIPEEKEINSLLFTFNEVMKTKDAEKIGEYLYFENDSSKAEYINYLKNYFIGDPTSILSTFQLEDSWIEFVYNKFGTAYTSNKYEKDGKILLTDYYYELTKVNGKWKISHFEQISE